MDTMTARPSSALTLLATCLMLAAAPLSTAAHAGGPHRSAGAHEHGHGTLNIAFEGGRVSMDLDAPGADILGFEREARTDADKAAVDAAAARLKDAAALFKLPAAAACRVVEAKVDLDDDDAAKTHAGKHDDHGPHTGIEAEYELSCGSLAAIKSIEFGYFKVFPNARSLTVNIVTPRAQSSFEVTRDKPVLDLGGLM